MSYESSLIVKYMCRNDLLVGRIYEPNGKS